MSSVVLELRPETELRLRENASKHGLSLEAYIASLADREAAELNGKTINKAASPASLDEMLRPVREAFAQSGATEEEFAELIEETRQEIWQEKQAKKS